ncbi:hypothetical protein SVAN01_02479 [Stagonosporopsis vannaccii]|nr:hypothetical protein SVAN01_02479 [Stagonosporopsis vannaccii]
MVSTSAALRICLPHEKCLYCRQMQSLGQRLTPHTGRQPLSIGSSCNAASYFGPSWARGSLPDARPALACNDDAFRWYTSAVACNAQPWLTDPGPGFED